MQASNANAGVHGMGLTHAAFLPTAVDADGAGAERGALLEILPSTMGRTHSEYDYARWSSTNGVRLFRLRQPVHADCFGQYWRTCGNVSVVVSSVVKELRAMQTYVSHGLR